MINVCKPHGVKMLRCMFYWPLRWMAVMVASSRWESIGSMKTLASDVITDRIVLSLKASTPCMNLISSSVNGSSFSPEVSWCSWTYLQIHCGVNFFILDSIRPRL